MTFWAAGRSTPEDLGLLAGASRVHAVDGTWLERVRNARAFAYRLPSARCDPDPEVGGYWLSRDAVAPLETVRSAISSSSTRVRGSSFA